MDQLIQEIQKRAGIEEGQARTAAETVVGFLKNRLPGPLAGQIDGVLEGGEGTGSPKDSVMDRASGILGGGRKR